MTSIGQWSLLGGLSTDSLGALLEFPGLEICPRAWQLLPNIITLRFLALFQSSNAYVTNSYTKSFLLKYIIFLTRPFLLIDSPLKHIS